MNEAAWFEQVRQLLQLTGWTWYHTLRSDGSNAGFPDIIAVRAGDPRLLAIELKSSRGSVSAAQKTWLRLLAGRLAETHVWFPVDAQRAANTLSNGRLEVYR